MNVADEFTDQSNADNGVNVADKFTDEVLELQHDQFHSAKQAELQSWKDHNMYEVVTHTRSDPQGVWCVL